VKIECTGLIGKLFGHKYERYILNSTPPKFGNHDFRGSVDGFKKFIELNTEYEYIVCCKRCGKVIDETQV